MPGSAVGDFLRTVQLFGLNRDREARRALASLFGLTLLDIDESAPQSTPPSQTPSFDSAPRPPPPVLGPRGQQPQPDAPQPIPSSVQSLSTPEEAQPPTWVVNAPRLAPTQRRVIMAKPTLLAPYWQRAILTTALSTVGDTREPDVERLIDHVVHQRPVQRVPMRSALTLARGAYCWLDQSAAMQPFVADQTDLVHALRSTLSATRLMVRSTTGVPSRTVPLLRLVPHLVLSDLGARQVPDDGVTERPEHWKEWAASIEAEFDARVIALVPGPIDRYPADLRKVCRIVRWDRQSSVQTVRRALTWLDA